MDYLKHTSILHTYNYNITKYHKSFHKKFIYFMRRGLTIKPIIHVHCCSSSESKLMTDTAALDLVWIILFKIFILIVDKQHEYTWITGPSYHLYREVFG